MNDDRDKIDVGSIRRELQGFIADKNKAEGRIEAILQNLDEQFGIKSVEEAEKKLGELGGEITAVEEKLNESLDELDKYVGEEE